MGKQLVVLLLGALLHLLALVGDRPLLPVLISIGLQLMMVQLMLLMMVLLLLLWELRLLGLPRTHML
jgi:hypothetical protein